MFNIIIKNKSKIDIYNNNNIIVRNFLCDEKKSESKINELNTKKTKKNKKNKKNKKIEFY